MTVNGEALVGDHHRRSYRPHDRIAIVGAGPSGLVIAAELNKRGFSNVVLFERGSRVGGKVATQWLNGYPTELGAIWVLSRYANVRSLLKEHGLNLDRFPIQLDIKSADGTLGGLWPTLVKKCGSRLAALLQLWRAIRIAKRIDKQPGLGHAGPDVAEPLELFARRHGCFGAADGFRPLAIACGWAHYESVPAAYFLKQIPRSLAPFLRHFLTAPNGRSRNVALMVREGYQTLWQRVASRAKLDVRFGVNIQQITARVGANEVVLHLENESQEIFDCVFVTSPASSWRHQLDAHLVEERRLTQIKSIRYRSVIAEVTGLPHEWACFYEENCFPNSGPGVIKIANYRAATNDYLLYQVLPLDCTQDEADRRMRADLSDLGAKQIEVKVQQEWHHYLPHVSSDDFAAGFHRNLEEHQGRHGIFLAGPLLNAESVEHAVEYAKDLVRRFVTNVAALILACPFAALAQCQEVI